MSIRQWTSARSLSFMNSILLKGALIGSIILPFAVATQVRAYEFPSPSTFDSPASHTPEAVVALRRAIIGQESGANFRAVNRHSGALGYGQVMPANVPSWSREALGYSLTPDQFLNSPELQLKVIDHKLNEYWQAALVDAQGNEAIAVRRVASHWYSGKPYRYTSTRAQYSGGHRYPSVAEYTLQVLQRYEQEKASIQISQTSSGAQAIPVMFYPGMY